ncbi:MAG: C-GCAxxG-C-C family protein [Bacillota bacterium]
MKVKREYQNLTKEQLLDKIYELACDYEINAGSCSQSTVAAFHEVLGLDDSVVKVSTSLCGGVALQSIGTCGALSGGIMVLDYFFGRTVKEVQERDSFPILLAQQVAKELFAKFLTKYHTVICMGIIIQYYGRPYYFEDPDDAQELLELGTHSAEKCGGIVGQVARWVMEILIEKGAVEV